MAKLSDARKCVVSTHFLQNLCPLNKSLPSLQTVLGSHVSQQAYWQIPLEDTDFPRYARRPVYVDLHFFSAIGLLLVVRKYVYFFVDEDFISSVLKVGRISPMSFLAQCV